MCDLGFNDYLRLTVFYLSNLNSVQIRMELMNSIILFISNFIIMPLFMGVVAYYLWRDWSKINWTIRGFLILSLVFFITIMVLAINQDDNPLRYYGCKRKPFLHSEDTDTTVGFVYEYSYSCFRRGLWRGEGYVKYTYRVSDIDTVFIDEYRLGGSFMCNIDTGFYYVIVPRGKWENSIILLERRIPWDTIRAWRERRGQDNVGVNKVGEQ